MILTMRNSTQGLGFPKVMATPKAPNAIPIEPKMSKGLRPNFSTVKMATQSETRYSQYP